MTKPCASMTMKQGFTLIELMIGIVIMAILITQAVPSMSAYFRDSAIRRVADESSLGLQLAKAEAIRRNGTVLFTPAGTGWQVEAIPEGGGANIVVNTRVGQSSEAQVNLNASNASVGFTGSGRSTIAGNFILEVTNPTDGSCQDAGGNVRCLQIRVSASGQVRMCDPALAVTDPRAC